MRRKSTRNVKKSPEKPREETPRRSMRARRRSGDESADDSDIEKVQTIRSDYESENDSKNEASETESIPDGKSRRKRKEESGTKKTRRTRARVSPIKEEPDKEPESNDSDREPEEKKGKGKSKTKSKIDQTSNIDQETHSNSEISENVQVTLQSPPIDNENVDESNKNVEQTEIETAECVKNAEENNTENCEQQSQKAEETNNKQDEQVDTSSEKVNNSVEERSASPEQPNQREAQVKQPMEVDAEHPHNEAKKQKKAESEQEEAQSKPNTEAKADDKNEMVEANNDNKKTAEWSSNYEKENEKVEDDLNTSKEDFPKKSRRSWVTSENQEARKRKISSKSQEGEKKEPEVVKKSTKKIKLVRRSYCEQSSIDESESSVEASVPRRRKNWGSVDYRSSDVCKVDVESLKEVCPKLEFLEENEVKLEPVVRRDSHVSIDNEKLKKERRESESQKSDSDKSMVEGENEEPVIDKNIIAMNRKISIVDDTASKLKPPPSPAKNPVSEVLFISNLVRPFTLKALKELLERTGKLKKENGFWTDKIKSKCIIEYETAEEAEATRNALHGIHWPIGNGKKLQIEYSTKEELDKALNPPPIPVPVVPEKVEKENKVPTGAVVDAKHGRDKEKRGDEKRRRSGEHVREWDLGKEDRRGRSRSRERVRRHSRRSPSPSDDFIGRKHRKAEEAVPQKLMDDLFLKTKATPSIYWQPLSPEEIQMKQQQREIRMEEHKRRMEGTRPPMGGGGGRDRGGRGGPPYRRRYD